MECHGMKLHGIIKYMALYVVVVICMQVTGYYRLLHSYTCMTLLVNEILLYEPACNYDETASNSIPLHAYIYMVLLSVTSRQVDATV